MGARRNHYYYIDRYPIGLDATVFKSGSGSTQTMSFTERHAVPAADPRLQDPRRRQRLCPVRPVQRPERAQSCDRVSDDQERPAGVGHGPVHVDPAGRCPQANRAPVDGKDVWRTVTVYENGKVIHQTTYYLALLAGSPGIVLVGK